MSCTRITCSHLDCWEERAAAFRADKGGVRLTLPRPIPLNSFARMPWPRALTRCYTDLPAFIGRKRKETLS